MQSQLTEEQVRLIIRDELQKLIKSDRYIFEKDIQLMDGNRIRIGGNKGSTIGDANSKIGFFGTTPVTKWNSGTGRQDLINATGGNITLDMRFNGNTGTTYYGIGDIVAALKAVGLLAS